MGTTKAPEDLLATLRRGNRFLLTSHVSPDGDAIGSELGLARILRSLGKGAVIWNRDPTPPLFAPLPGADRIHTGVEPPAGWPDKFDGVLVLECPSVDRTGLADHLFDRPVANIDHHLGNQHYGAVNWVDSASPAVGEMVYRLALGLKATVEADTADLLLLTLVSDTGGFRFANATPAAFEAAAALVRDGADPAQVSLWLYESRPPAMVRLLGEMLATLQLSAGGRLAVVDLEPAMFARAGASPGDSEGLIDVPRTISGVAAVALFRAREDGTVKVSLRSRGDLDVEAVARRHGGGGHKNAAGFVLAAAEAAAGREQTLAALADLVEAEAAG